jgi:prepilin-type N-terminal cleavage/methylation domain-containing protein
MTTYKSCAGFTLVELLVVLAIIATLLSLAAPRYTGSVDKAKESVLRENLSTTATPANIPRHSTIWSQKNIYAMCPSTRLPIATPPGSSLRLAMRKKALCSTSKAAHQAKAAMAAPIGIGDSAGRSPVKVAQPLILLATKYKSY